SPSSPDGQATPRVPPAAGSLSVEGAAVSAIRRERVGGPLVVRIHNLGDTTATATVRHRGALASGELVDLRGAVVGHVDQGTVRLRPWEIATLSISDQASGDTPTSCR